MVKPWRPEGSSCLSPSTQKTRRRLQQQLWAQPTFGGSESFIVQSAPVSYAATDPPNWTCPNTETSLPTEWPWLASNLITALVSTYDSALSVHFSLMLWWPPTKFQVLFFFPNSPCFEVVSSSETAISILKTF